MIDNKCLFELRPVGGLRDVIAAGPITKQRMTTCYRIELCDLGDTGFVVCHHYLEIPPNGTPTHWSYGDGDYFKKGELEQAMLCFGHRLMRDAAHVSSILPDQESERNSASASVPPSVPDDDSVYISQLPEATN